MLAEMPERRMSGKPTSAPITAAVAPPARAPAGAGHLLYQEFRQGWQEDRLLGRGHREQRRHIGSDRHEADVAKREHPRVAREDIEADDADQHDEGLGHTSLQNDRREGRSARDHNDEYDEEDQGRETRGGFPKSPGHMRCRRLRDGKRPSGRTIRTSATTTKTKASRKGRSASGSKACSKIEATPTRKPPIAAPGKLPRPPMTVPTKAITTSWSPMRG